MRPLGIGENRQGQTEDARMRNRQIRGPRLKKRNKVKKKDGKVAL